MSVTKSLFPPANREAAVVAFLRTAWQVIRATGVLGGAGIITVNAADVAHINLQLLGYTAAAVLISGIVSGLISAGDILAHGLPDAYTSNAAASIPAAIVSTVPDNVANTHDTAWQAADGTIVAQVPATPAEPAVPVDPALPAVADPAAPAV